MYRYISTEKRVSYRSTLFLKIVRISGQRNNHLIELKNTNKLNLT